jgi:hypothetical protein
MVLGIRVHGAKVEDHEVTLDSLFREVPVPTKLGIPLMYKKMSGTGGDDSHIRNNIIVRFMADPDDGFAPADWQYGGMMGPAPPVVLARRDKLPFSSEDWGVIDDYISQWLEARSEAEEDCPQVSDQFLNPAAFQTYVQGQLEMHPTAFLPLQFPAGSSVVATGLSIAELNGVEGEVIRYTRERIGVRFPNRDVTALKPERLSLVRKAPTLPNPKPKRLDTGDAEKRREARTKELEHQESVQIARRFCECLHEDTFPEMGDLHLFGVGCEYKSRAQDALAVWQGAVKTGELTEETIAEALVNGTIKELFYETCRKLAKSRSPNSTYAMDLIKNNFAALEWDAL